MHIDMPQTSQLSALQDLWKQAFGDEGGFWEGFFRVGFSPNHCRCLWEDSNLASALFWFDCDWKGKKIAYLFAIATEESQQGKGYCRRLMESTHELLKAQGYAGAILVPETDPLFSLYEKFGYRPCCPVEQKVVLMGDEKAAIRKITDQEYARLQQQYLPEDAVFHTQTALQVANLYTDFYAGDGFAFCGGEEHGTFYFQEFLGDTTAIPQILKTLQVKTGHFRDKGSKPFAMYRSFSGDSELPSYFDIPMN